MCSFPLNLALIWGFLIMSRFVPQTDIGVFPLENTLVRALLERKAAGYITYNNMYFMPVS